MSPRPRGHHGSGSTIRARWQYNEVWRTQTVGLLLYSALTMSAESQSGPDRDHCRSKKALMRHTRGGNESKLACWSIARARRLASVPSQRVAFSVQEVRSKATRSPQAAWRAWRQGGASHMAAGFAGTHRKGDRRALCFLLASILALRHVGRLAQQSQKQCGRKMRSARDGNDSLAPHQVRPVSRGMLGSCRLVDPRLNFAQCWQ